MTRAVVTFEGIQRWAWKCDNCTTMGPIGTLSRSSIPTEAEMAAQGWFVAKTWGDRCQTCVLHGLAMDGLVEFDGAAPALRTWLASVDTSRLGPAVRVARDGWHAARRWQDPMPLPAWVKHLRAVVGPAAECFCDTCRTADERAGRNAEHERILRETIAAECSTRGHSAADWAGCSRCGAQLSTAEWTALAGAELDGVGRRSTEVAP